MLGEQVPLLSQNIENNVPSNSKLMFKILFVMSILSLSLHIFHLCIYQPVLDIGQSKEIQSSLKELRKNLEVAMQSKMDFSRQEFMNITKNQNESFNIELNLTKEAMASQMDFLRQELLNVARNQTQVNIQIIQFHEISLCLIFIEVNFTEF